MNTLTLTNEIIDFNRLSSSQIKSTLLKYNIGLSEDEILHVQNTLLERPPTLSECLLWSIEGSEHCSYKSSKQFLKTLPTQGEHLIIGVGEDAAVVSVATSTNGYRYGIAISHESHNHPSQIVPFEGAATGVGGNIRDIACMGATVIAVADSLRFGEFNNNKTRWLNKEVVSGIASYGNALGIPNIAGDVAYHDSYQNNCLVTVVSLGVVREDKVIHSTAPKNADGYALILIGKATDNSGFGGASFASSQLNEEEANRGAVQEPNAFLARHLLKANQALIEQLDQDNLLSQVAFKDLGAGGIGCASVEIAEGGGFGANINLDNVHVSMQDLHPSVILCAETQERFMWAVPQSLVKSILDHYNKTFDLPNVSHNAKASHIGFITKDKQYVVSHQNTLQIDAKASDVTEGLIADRQYTKPPTEAKKINQLKQPKTLSKALLTLLSSPNIACQKEIYNQYDKQVQGRTVIERGQANAGVLSPFNDNSYPKDIQKTGIALTCSQNPRHTALDPYWGTQKALISALERIISVGASPIALTDCLCFGNPENPHHMWPFVESVRAIENICKNYPLYNEKKSTIPIVAGNVSFYNEVNTHAIAPSPIFSCLGSMKDANKALTKAFKHKDSEIYLLREDTPQMSGSIYSEYFHSDSKDQALKISPFKERMHFMLSTIDKHLISSINTIEEGGLAVSLALMSIASNIGFEVNITSQAHTINTLFSETNGFIFEVEKANCEALRKHAEKNNMNIIKIGDTKNSAYININNQIKIKISEAKAAWQKTLSEALQ